MQLVVYELLISRLERQCIIVPGEHKPRAATQGLCAPDSMQAHLQILESGSRSSTAGVCRPCQRRGQPHRDTSAADSSRWAGGGVEEEDEEKVKITARGREGVTT